jgi:hypothetical protein
LRDALLLTHLIRLNEKVLGHLLPLCKKCELCCGVAGS